MSGKRIILGAILGLTLLASCQPQTPAAIPTSQTWQVTRDVNLAWLGTAMSDCLINSPGIALSIHEAPLSKINTTGTDIILLWGNLQTVPENTFSLGWDELVVVVHPDNSIASLTMSQVRSILAGKTRTWNKVIPELKDEAEKNLDLWVYPPGDEAQSVLRSAIGNSSALPATAHLAPSPQAMFEAISTQENAVGFLPSRRVTPSVKIVPISDLAEGILQQPIVAILQSPLPAQQNWLSCLQTSITQPSN